MGRKHRLDVLLQADQPLKFPVAGDLVHLNAGGVIPRLVHQILFEFMRLVVVMHGLYCLLKPYGNEQADADRGDVDEEIFPCVRGAVGRVDV